MKKNTFFTIILLLIASTSFAADSTSFNPSNLEITAKSSSSMPKRKWYPASSKGTNNYGYEIIVTATASKPTYQCTSTIKVDGKLIQSNENSMVSPWIYTYGSVQAVIPQGSSWQASSCSGTYYVLR